MHVSKIPGLMFRRKLAFFPLFAVIDPYRHRLWSRIFSIIRNHTVGLVHVGGGVFVPICAVVTRRVIEYTVFYSRMMVVEGEASKLGCVGFS